MAEPDRYADLDPDAVGRRIGELLDRLAGTLPQEAWAEVTELTGLLSAVHGAALARILAYARSLPAGEQLAGAIAADPLVASLVVVHDLDPGAHGAAVPVHLGRRRS